MASFIRTIPQAEHVTYVDEILSRTRHFIPLKLLPKRAGQGDFVYLAHRGKLVGRAVIDRIQPVGAEVPIGSDRDLYGARWLVHYSTGWQRAPRAIPFRGRQGIRYLNTEGLQQLDSERW